MLEGGERALEVAGGAGELLEGVEDAGADRAGLAGGELRGLVDEPVELGEPDAGAELMGERAALAGDGVAGGELTVELVELGGEEGGLELEVVGHARRWRACARGGRRCGR